MQNKKSDSILSCMNGKKKILTVTLFGVFALASLSQVSALSYAYLKDKSGEVIEKIYYDEQSFAKVLKLNTYCSFKAVSTGARCFLTEKNTFEKGGSYSTAEIVGYKEIGDNNQLATGTNVLYPTIKTKELSKTQAILDVKINPTVAQPSNKFIVSEKPAEKVIQNIKTEIVTPVKPVAPIKEVVLQQQKPVPTPTAAPTNTTSRPQIVYQVIEKAVPGPAGRDGKDGLNGRDGASGGGSTQFLSQYATGGQYNGFGATTGTAVDPTGNASLSKISGAGLSSCNLPAQKVVYNSTTALFECATDLQGAGGGFSGGNLSAQVVNATTSLFTPVLYASTSNASTSNANSFFGTLGNFTNLLASLATFTAATSTNMFANVSNLLTAYITNLLFTNATGTSATTTNFFTTNFSGTNLTATNINNTNLQSSLATFTSGTSTNWYTGNFQAINASTTNSLNANLIAANATFSYATVTNGFFTNLSVSGPLAASLQNGFTFRGSTTSLSEATSTIFVANSGKVGIGGTTTPSEVLSVQGNVLVSGNFVAPNFSNLAISTGADRILCVSPLGVVTKDSLQSCYGFYSDETLKKNIATVTNVLDKIKMFRTVNFNWIDEENGTTTQIGYIAQEVQKAFPEVIIPDGLGKLKVNYQALSAIYINAIKELDERVGKIFGDIVNRVVSLESRTTILEQKVNYLESRQGVVLATSVTNAVWGTGLSITLLGPNPEHIASTTINYVDAGAAAIFTDANSATTTVAVTSDFFNVLTPAAIGSAASFPAIFTVTYTAIFGTSTATTSRTVVVD